VAMKVQIKKDRKAFDTFKKTLLNFAKISTAPIKTSTNITGEYFELEMPHCNTDTFQIFLNEFSEK